MGNQGNNDPYRKQFIMNLIQIPKGPKYVGETGHPVAGSDMGRKEIYLRDS